MSARYMWNPYVGEGADGMRRSAQIDREEAETLDAGDPRRFDLLERADEWERRARLAETVPHVREIPRSVAHGRPGYSAGHFARVSGSFPTARTLCGAEPTEIDVAYRDTKTAGGRRRLAESSVCEKCLKLAERMPR